MREARMILIVFTLLFLSFGEMTSSGSPLVEKSQHDPFPARVLSTDNANEFLERVEKLVYIKQTLQILHKRRSQQCGSLFSPNFTHSFRMKKIKGFKHQRSIISIPVDTGLSDRVVGTVSNFLVALLTDRYFVYSARGNSTYPDILYESFDFPYVEAFKSPPVPIHEKSYTYNQSFSYEFDNRSYFVNNYIGNFPLLVGIRYYSHDLYELSPSNKDIVILLSHLGFSLDIFNYPHHKARLNALGLTPFTTFGCIFEFLFQPKPILFLSPDYFHIFQLLTNHLYRPSSSSPSNSSLTVKEKKEKVLKIGIHLRLGDNILSGERLGDQVKSYEGIFECARQIESFALERGNYSHAIWYLISDSKEFRSFALEKYGSNKILTTIPSRISHSASANAPIEVLHEAVAEWWLYSLTDYRVISAVGGFAVSAASRLPFEKLTYRVNALDPKEAIHCGEGDYRKTYEMEQDWPGI